MLPQHIEKRVRVTPRCWQWLGATNNHHYGMVGVNGRILAAHRVVFEAYRHPIPSGLSLDHLCGNSDCVNPDHLEPVTHAENRRRSAASVCRVCGGPRTRYSTGRGYRCVSCHLKHQRDYQRARRA